MDKINDNPETWHSVKQKISKIMGNKLLGRPTPVKKPKITVSDEMLKLKFESPFRHSYPKRLVKDTDKHNFLKEKFKQGDIQYHIYEDLVSMLDVKEEDIIPKIDFKGGVQ
ncbi:hypothetical protein [Oceanihabitans sediminis]|uniref:hypothetical protein n=1 Tax=Oceanihabitans sediminis TaxID=1812012 RepID=UPI00299DC46B|nr:hypothetical protein [Oceanihabitans sediminis]MDX1279359.1 hypothetical protein [Oceanihabitans sediminis]